MVKGKKQHIRSVVIIGTYTFQVYVELLPVITGQEAHSKRNYEFLKFALGCSLKIVNPPHHHHLRHQNLLGYFQIICKKIFFYIVGQNQTAQFTQKINEHKEKCMWKLVPFILLHKVLHSLCVHVFKAKTNHQPLLAT